MCKEERAGRIYHYGEQTATTARERIVSSNSNSFNKQADFPDILVGIELTKYNQEFKPDGVCGRHRKPEERGPVGTA